MIKGSNKIIILLGIIWGFVFHSVVYAQQNMMNDPGFRQNSDIIFMSRAHRGVVRQTSTCCQSVAFADRSEPPMIRHFVRLSLNADTHFDFNRSTLKPAGIAALNGLINRVAALDPGYGMGRIGYVTGIDAIGHTDWIGSNRYNDRLGSRRASTVRRYLMAHGVPGGFINTQSLGELQPVADNRNAQGRAQNRRVEVMVRTVTIPQ